MKTLLAALVAAKNWLVLHATCVLARATYWAGVLWLAIRPWAYKAVDEIQDTAETVKAQVSEKASEFKRNVSEAIDEAPTHQGLGWYGGAVFAGLVVIMALAVVCMHEVYPPKWQEIRPATLDLPPTPEQLLAESQSTLASKTIELETCTAKLAAKAQPIAPLMSLPTAEIKPLEPVAQAPAVSSSPVYTAPKPRRKRKARYRVAPVYDPLQPAFWEQSPAVFLKALE